MVVRVCRNIVAKKSVLPSMSKPRRNFYMVRRESLILHRVNLNHSDVTPSNFISNEVGRGMLFLSSGFEAISDCTKLFTFSAYQM
jgi:tRNA A-37 threonylcarbamoyl transferase component Bud32